MKESAGILLYKTKPHLQVFLVHPGGPFWKNKDAGAWSVPKGEIMEGEEPLQRARTEFAEETGREVEGQFVSLGAVRQKGGKTVHCWAIEGDIHAASIVSNHISIEWPPRSGRTISVPEVDRGGWYSISGAKEKINPAQAAFLDRLEELIV